MRSWRHRRCCRRPCTWPLADRAEGARAVRAVLGDMLGDELVGCLAFGDPLVEDGVDIDTGGTVAAYAVVHAWRDEETVGGEELILSVPPISSTTLL
jgi:hypothetical protein